MIGFRAFGRAASLGIAAILSATIATAQSIIPGSYPPGGFTGSKANTKRARQPKDLRIDRNN